MLKSDQKLIFFKKKTDQFVKNRPYRLKIGLIGQNIYD